MLSSQWTKKISIMGEIWRDIEKVYEKCNAFTGFTYPCVVYNN
jgi:hypothetical protein